MNLPEKIIFHWKLHTGKLKVRWLFFLTLLFKRCYYGPFTGEFGHLLAHNLPFIAYLHSKGVRVHFCGIEIFRPFFIDENGNSIVSEYISVPDFYNVSSPISNKASEPKDVEHITKKFSRKARFSFYPYWDIGNDVFYWYTFRNWTMKRAYIKVHDFSRVYKTKKENSVIIFPRKKVSPVQINNGELWDYFQIANEVKKYFDKVYVIGHPAFSIEFIPFDNVEVIITNDNRQILEKCCNSRLLISTHSGTVYLGEYTDTPVLIIYKGGRTIGNLEPTKQFKNALGTKYPFNYAFNMEEIINFIKKNFYHYETTGNRLFS